MPSNKELLSTPVTITMSLSDWVVLTGWCGANLNSSTPIMINAIIRHIAEAVIGGE